MSSTSLLDVRGDISAELAKARLANGSRYFRDPDYLGDGLRDARLAGCGDFELLDLFKRAAEPQARFSRDTVLHELSYRAVEVVRSVAYCEPLVIDTLIERHLPKDGFRNAFVHLTKYTMPPQSLADALIEPLLEYRPIMDRDAGVMVSVPVVADEHRDRFRAIVEDIVTLLPGR